jgi:hypothetical protein
MRRERLGFRLCDPTAVVFTGPLNLFPVCSWLMAPKIASKATSGTRPAEP